MTTSAGRSRTPSADDAAAPGKRRRAAARIRGLRPALAFLLPALLVLGALVVYPIIATVVRSLYDKDGHTFVGLGNYGDALGSARTRTALRNNAIWVVVAPVVVTAFGLLLAVLTERVRWSTAFRLVVFMPIAISSLAAGVIFRIVYDAAPERGVANAVVTSIADTLHEPGHYQGALSRGDVLRPEGDGFAARGRFVPGDQAALALVGLQPKALPRGTRRAAPPAPAVSGRLTGSVWLDFAPGGAGAPNRADPAERGMPGVRVEARAGGHAVGSAVTGADGRFSIAVDRPVTLHLTESAFREPYHGVDWLGPRLVTPSIIGAYVWIWTGFAMIIIGAGLAAIPRDALEAARVDGATEWQVFRRVTAPLLAPVLVVALITLMINVLKVFDLVLVIPSGGVQDDANVLALEMWRVSFGGARDQGVGSALGVLLLLLVVPAMVFNIRRFRQERS